MPLKINNPYYRTAAEAKAEEMTGRVNTALEANAAAIGAVAGLAEIKSFLSPADQAALTAPVFRALCKLNGWGIAEHE